MPPRRSEAPVAMAGVAMAGVAALLFSCGPRSGDPAGFPTTEERSRPSVVFEARQNLTTEIRPLVYRQQRLPAERRGLPRAAGRDRQTGGRQIGVWRRLDNDPRFLLPERLGIDRHPGLRLLHLDGDGEVDLLLAQERRPLRAWRWDAETDRWQEPHAFFRPHQALATTRHATGSVLSGLAMRFRDASSRNTNGFLSQIASTYRPSADGSTLEYTSQVCFPRIKTVQSRRVYDPAPDGDVWHCQDDSRLALPVPLQWAGDHPWPLPKPGLKSTERPDSQGAQLLQLGRDGETHLVWIGLLYRDAATGENLVPVARHRYPENCTPRYRTHWDRRPVDVELCQAVWRSRVAAWSDHYGDLHGDKPFWERVDSGDGDGADGRWTFPTTGDPARLWHFEAFRSVSFARLDPFGDATLFAFVVGEAQRSSRVEVDHPAVREIYAFIPEDEIWERIDPDDELVPPRAFLDSFSRRRFRGRFADLDGDGLDDAVVAIGRDNRRVWLNTGGSPRWLETPAYELPRECDLADGGCQLTDLDRDGDLDLFLGDGRLVFFNQGP